ncbi:MarR family winged helix-turn-helix transcriptional regulator [Pseudomonas chlororaphis]|uniref:MarR family transcriptional regulator n=1 Tax=Pseudomonas chlororaphis TaxID=587753 RepID=A0A1Q8EQA8_9PSED|nr:MarR family winged helix-turn-helix transcriptional regulator [Pseudomonas chlororaphis]OLF53972.1 MarR family transcriptional regulator [Pseudomonas chlororaphis]
MHEPEPTPAGAVLTDFILSMFRASNLTLAWGDRIVAPLGLTSARWQILGAIAAAERPQPVAWLARDLEANRQNVQRIVNDLAKEGLVTFQPNPHHRRAQLVLLTDKGTTAFNQAIGLYTPLVNDLSAGLEVEEIQTALRVITQLRSRLEGQANPEE